MKILHYVDKNGEIKEVTQITYQPVNDRYVFTDEDGTSYKLKLNEVFNYKDSLKEQSRIFSVKLLQEINNISLANARCKIIMGKMNELYPH